MGMAAHTRFARILILVGGMAAIAGGNSMQANQREAAEIVVKSHFGVKTLVIVALFTGVAELTFVNVLVFMAVDAGGADGFGFITGVVAAFAG